MKLNVTTEHITISDDEREYLENKLSGLQNYSRVLKRNEEAVIVDAVLQLQQVKSSDQQVVIKVTMSVPHAIIRGEAFGQTVNEVVDLVEDKLKRQIRRYKEKHLHDMHDKKSGAEASVEAAGMEDGDGDGDEGESDVAMPGGKSDDITKRKLFTDLYPMTEQEAIDQMQTLGHTFFIFVNQRTDRYNLVYQREGNQGYGLVELEQREGVLNG